MIPENEPSDHDFSPPRAIAVVYQLSLTGGVPFLFILHMLSRRKQTSRVLLWVLVPLLFMGTAILVAIMHPSS